MKVITKDQVKRRMVKSMVASLNIENLNPNAKIVSTLNDYATQGGSTQLLINEVLARNVALRSR